MISTLAITGYRSRRDIRLQLDTLNVVTGANGHPQKQPVALLDMPHASWDIVAVPAQSVQTDRVAETYAVATTKN